MIDASGGVLDQDYEMFEQQTPHRLIKPRTAARQRPAPASGAAGWASKRVFEIGSDDTQLVTFGDGDFEGAFGHCRRQRGRPELHPPRPTPTARPSCRSNKDLITGVPKGTVYHQVANGRRRLGRSHPARPRPAGRRGGQRVITPEAARRDYGFEPAK
jgi:N-methylhydantoinase B